MASVGSSPDYLQYNPHLRRRPSRLDRMTGVALIALSMLLGAPWFYRESGDDKLSVFTDTKQ